TLPLFRRAGAVPLVLRRVDLRVLEPVPLAVQHVMTDLHVLDDFRDTKDHGADSEQRPPENAGKDSNAAEHGEKFLPGHDTAQVGFISRTTAVHDTLAKCSDTRTELLQFLFGKMGGGRNGGHGTDVPGLL